jgi:hypothetical protein
MLAGKISTAGVKTVATQSYSTDALTVSLDPSNSVATFRASQPGTINFDLGMTGGQMNMGSATGVTRVIIDGLTNFTGTGIGLASVGFPVQEAASASSAASNSMNLENAAQFKQQVGSLRGQSDSSSVSVAMDENVREEGRKQSANTCGKDEDLPECR